MRSLGDEDAAKARIVAGGTVDGRAQLPGADYVASGRCSLQRGGACWAEFDSGGIMPLFRDRARCGIHFQSSGLLRGQHTFACHGRQSIIVMCAHLWGMYASLPDPLNRGVAANCEMVMIGQGSGWNSSLASPK